MAENLDDLSSDTRGLAKAYGLSTDDDSCIIAKPIFILSDCTGESASFTVRSALNQFEGFIGNQCPANLVIFRFLEDPQYLRRIMQRAKDEDALVVYTLVDPQMGNTIRTLSDELEVRAVDLWGNLLDLMERHLAQQRIGLPLGNPARRQSRLGYEYFKFIEAVEYTRKMDDGSSPNKWKNCDIFILGLSRCGKTPLSIFLGQRGFKVANYPLCQGCQIPPQIHEVDPKKVFCLKVDAKVLATIRGIRYQELGVNDNNFKYNDIRSIKEEVEWVENIYTQNPEWTQLDVTFRSVEESAAQIQRLITQRFQQENEGVTIFG